MGRVGRGSVDHCSSNASYTTKCLKTAGGRLHCIADNHLVYTPSGGHQSHCIRWRLQLYDTRRGGRTYA
ncbi:hypothetical protein KC319_g20455 [Hortaea werneckii]|nr:hypothetical protein KC319_g20455 [Hortaea werneckii]